jgi:hypothetical protein
MDVLGIFAKWPRPGQVKTRLGGTPEWAAGVARAFLLDTLSRMSAVADRRVVAFAPDDADADFAALAGDPFALAAQGDGDLGERLGRFFARELAGADRAVAVGADSPTLPVEYVREAFHLLEEVDLVLGPATDGGYYLVGCRHPLPIFAGIDWGGAGVLGQTVARLTDPEWKLAILPPWYDVDTPEGWAMLTGHIKALRRAGLDPGVPATEQLLEAMP